MIDIEIYKTEHGVCPYMAYLNALRDRLAKSKIMSAVNRMESGHMPQTRSLAGGLQEIKIHVGEGHRLYFYRDGQKLVVLLSASNKKDQAREIKSARTYLEDYKRQKAHKSTKGKLK